MKLQILLIFFCTLLLLPIATVFATEPILITVSEELETVIFDGKWSYTDEWKRSTETVLYFDDGSEIRLRTAHQGDFIYVLVDSVSDQTLDFGSDKATICIDGKNNKNKFADSDDFCFSTALGHRQGTMYQGGSPTGLDGNLRKIPNQSDFIGISNISDRNDRYSVEPHPNYEFKIPINLFGRSDNYGFYLSVYDASVNKFYTWPKESKRENIFAVPSPSSWGDIISPDKSLPEFDFPLLVLLPSLVLVFYCTRIRLKL